MDFETASTDAREATTGLFRPHPWAKYYIDFMEQLSRDPNKPSSGGFTRLDLLVLLTALGVLGLVAGSALAQSETRSQQAVCASNLQRIGQGFHLWSNDHKEVLPWRVPLAQGGSMSGSKPGNVWQEFAYLSNFVASPRILVCPADTINTRIASNFSNRPEGGLLHFSFRANAVSYFLGLDAFPINSEAWIAGDRNIRVDALNVGCSSGILNAVQLNGRGSPSVAGWTNSIHQWQGNLLHYDGRVSQASTEQLRTQLQTLDDNGSVHLLMPR